LVPSELTILGWVFGLATCCAARQIFPASRWACAIFYPFLPLGLGDEGTRLILEAHRPFLLLDYLHLGFNGITPIGLQVLTDVLPLTLLHLNNLGRNGNEGLFDEEQITQRFVDRILLSDDMALEELHVQICGHYVSAIVKSCEHVKTKLRMLHIVAFEYWRGRLHIRDQLIKSLPKMKRSQELICDHLFDRRRLTVFMATGDGKVLLDDPIMAALHKNTSLVKISDGRMHRALLNLLVVPILDRNQMLHHADSLLGPQIAGTMPRIHSRSGLWPDAFARMKPAAAVREDHPYHQNVGASAIFKILRQRPLMVRFQEQQQQR
jgi:hypothetical protein